MVFRPRNRIVVFRLSDDEYERLKAVSAVRGARNVSDFARSELLVAMARGGSEIAISLSDLQKRLDRVEALLERLSNERE